MVANTASTRLDFNNAKLAYEEPTVLTLKTKTFTWRYWESPRHKLT